MSLEDIYKRLNILIAHYGGKNVTSFMKDRIDEDKSICAYELFYGGALPGCPKFMHLIYSYAGVVSACAICEEQTAYPLPAMITILAALYGSEDVTEKVRKLIPDDQDTMTFKVDKDTLGDPNPGVQKDFTIAYVRNGERKVLLLKEGSVANLV